MHSKIAKALSGLRLHRCNLESVKPQFADLFLHLIKRLKALLCLLYMSERARDFHTSLQRLKESCSKALQPEGLMAAEDGTDVYYLFGLFFPKQYNSKSSEPIFHVDNGPKKSWLNIGYVPDSWIPLTLGLPSTKAKMLWSLSNLLCCVTLYFYCLYTLYILYYGCNLWYIWKWPSWQGSALSKSFFPLKYIYVCARMRVCDWFIIIDILRSVECLFINM